MTRSRPYLLLGMVVLLWGSNFVVARVLSGFDPIHVSGILYAFFRYFFGAFTMIAVLVYQKRNIQKMREHIAPYTKPLLLSAFFSAIFVIAIHSSAEYVSSGTTSIIVNLCPIVVFIFGILFLGERLTWTKVVGFIVGLAAGLFFLWSTFSLSPGFELGIIFALIGLFAWAAYTITLHYLEGADSFIVMTIKHSTSSLMIIPFILLFVLDGGNLVFILDMWTILGLLFAGVLASGLAYILYFSAIEMIGAPKASSILFLVPFVSLLGDFILGEPPQYFALLAGVIAILGVALIRFSDIRD